MCSLYRLFSLLLLGILHATAFNLDIPDSFQKASEAFNKLLSRTPDDPQANYRYGSFLAATTRKGEGIPYLEAYTKRAPGDTRAAALLDAVRNNKVEFKMMKTEGKP